MGSRFNAPAIAGTPRRRCPRHWLVLAAFASRSNTSPQEGQTWVRTLRRLGTRAPQPLQSWVVNAEATASARFPAHAALYARSDRKWPHPASWMEGGGRAWRRAAFGRYPPLPSGTGAGRRLRLAGWMAS